MVSNFEEEISAIIWDLFFIEKSLALFKSAVYLIRINKEYFYECTDLEKLKQIFEENIYKFNKANELKMNLLLKKFKFDQNLIMHNRNYLFPIISYRINQTNESLVEDDKNKLKARKDICDLNWPYCIYECESNYAIHSYFIVKMKKFPKIIDNFYVAENKKIKEEAAINSSKDSDEILTNSSNYYNDEIDFDSALIERKPHVCNDKCYSAITSEIDEDPKKELNLPAEKVIVDYEKIKESYKNMRKNSNNLIFLGRNKKCISSISYVREKYFEEDNEDKSKGVTKNKVYFPKNYEDFLSKASFKCNLIYYII